jgi:hypothetical protein
MSTPTAVRMDIQLESESESSSEETVESAPLLRTEGLRSDPGTESARDAFNDLADELEAAAAGLSSTRRAMGHPAFAEILALGDAAIPALIDRLRFSNNRPLWLRLLGTLTPFPPGAGESTIDNAANVWIRWGRFAA